MQKKLIALAVAGLVSAPVMAQSNVQIYGIMDIGIQHLSGSEASGDGLKDRSRTAVEPSQQASSRLGFRGTEDLGNGLSAFFNIEQGINNDRSSATTGNRQAFVGLRGNFGQVALGRQFNPARQLITNLDPFGATGVGSTQNLQDLQTRYDNSIMYRTPNFSGFTVDFAFSNQVDGQEPVVQRGAPRTGLRGYSITPTYKNGPLMVGAAYERIENEVTAARLDAKTTRVNLAGSYDFGVVDVRATYGRVKDELQGAGSVKQNQWMLGAVAPVSEAGSVLASYTRVKADVPGISDPKASQWALGYTHALSKRTHLYGTYSKVNTNSSAEGFYGIAGGNNTVVDGEVVGTAAFTTGFAVGVRHNF